MRITRVLTAAGAAALLGACSHVVPHYQESVDTVAKLEQAGGGKVAVDEFRGDETMQVLHSRANTFKSPYGGRFSTYIQEALRLELARAGRFDPDAPVRVAGVLDRNALDIDGANVGSQEIAVRFTVTRDGRNVYERTHSAHREWASSFAGAIAIPAGRDAYPGTVTELLDSLFSDPAFLGAIR